MPRGMQMDQLVMGIFLLFVLAVGLSIAGFVWLTNWFANSLAQSRETAFWQEQYQDVWLQIGESEAKILAGERVIHKYLTAEAYNLGREAMAERGYRLEHELFKDPVDGYLVAEYVPELRVLEAYEA